MSTGIQWTDETWNPVVGCERVSPGCAHCYAKALHDMRHKALGEGKPLPPQYAVPFETVQLMPDRLGKPLKWRAPRRIFVNSVSDLFHDDVPDEFIAAVFGIMAAAERHTFQVLTKRPERMRGFLNGESRPSHASMREWCYYAARDLVGKDALDGCSPWKRDWPLSNLWFGVSVENQRWADERIPLLLQTPAAVRFLSCEPLLGPVDIIKHIGSTRDRKIPGQGIYVPPRISWVIVGGESGKAARPFDAMWARSIIDQCREAGVAPFVKQLGARPYDSLMAWRMVDRAYHPGPVQAQALGAFAFKHSHGDDPDEWPAELRVREFPEVRAHA
jgi:protein gp37